MMKHWILALVPAMAVTGFLALAAPASATDRDGGNDCILAPRVDWGDAPEGVLAYPGVIGKFPTCRQMNVVGTRELPPGCLPISTFPGVTGHIFHRPSETGPSYWLGCYFDALGQPMGVDNDIEGKVNQPAQGSSFCTNSPTDCVETAYGLTFDQDECFGDGSDAGVTSSLDFANCTASTLTFTTHNCATQSRDVVLNILIDINHDGDWNDAVLCGTDACAYEWAVKNLPITLPAGCGTQTSPGFLIGPNPGPSWLRISLTDVPVTDNYPWAGGAGEGGVVGGETEDYPAMIHEAVPALPSSWGSVKAQYR
jgi:hypothetical protein